MAGGFAVRETIERSPEDVWAYLTDFANAHAWMTAVDAMTHTTDGPLRVGTRFKFHARGRERETEVTALDPGRLIALTSTQGGVSATYTYEVMPAAGGTEVALDARCRASGIWNLLHPLIVFAMKRSDSSQLANLKAAMRGSD